MNAQSEWSKIRNKINYRLYPQNEETTQQTINYLFLYPFSFGCGWPFVPNRVSCFFFGVANCRSELNVTTIFQLRLVGQSTAADTWSAVFISASWFASNEIELADLRFAWNVHDLTKDGNCCHLNMNIVQLSHSVQCPMSICPRKVRYEYVKRHAVVKNWIWPVSNYHYEWKWRMILN